jgi:hypothetical protein
MMMTRSEHMAWCKQRAIEYVEKGDTANAFSSMASDLSKHPETEGHIGIQLVMSGMINTPEAMRNFIEGFN